MFSKRSAGIRASLTELRQAYEEQHGHSPDPAALIKLAQAATLDTRRDKEAPQDPRRPGAGSGGQEAHTLLHGEGPYTHHRCPLHGQRDRGRQGIEIASRADRSSPPSRTSAPPGRRQNVMAEANRWAREYAIEHGPVPAGTVEKVVSHSLRPSPSGSPRTRSTVDSKHSPATQERQTSTTAPYPVHLHEDP